MVGPDGAVHGPRVVVMPLDLCWTCAHTGRIFAGRNVAAGMTGGLGYFYDEEGDFTDKVNAEIVRIQRVCTSAGEAQLKNLISDHVERTGAPRTAPSPGPSLHRPSVPPCVRAGWRSCSSHQLDCALDCLVSRLCIMIVPGSGSSGHPKLRLIPWGGGLRRIPARPGHPGRLGQRGQQVLAACSAFRCIELPLSSTNIQSIMLSVLTSIDLQPAQHVNFAASDDCSHVFWSKVRKYVQRFKNRCDSSVWCCRGRHSRGVQGCGEPCHSQGPEGGPGRVRPWITVPFRPTQSAACMLRYMEAR